MQQHCGGKYFRPMGFIENLTYFHWWKSFESRLRVYEIIDILYIFLGHGVCNYVYSLLLCLVLLFGVFVVLGVTTSVLGMSSKFEVWREDSRGASTLLRRVSVWWASRLILIGDRPGSCRADKDVCIRNTRRSRFAIVHLLAETKDFDCLMYMKNNDIIKNKSSVVFFINYRYA